MSFKVPWTPCYPKITTLDRRLVGKIYVEVLAADRDAILSVALQPAILNQICQLAIRDTAAYVRKHSLTYADAQRLFHHVCERTFTEPPSASHARDVRSGATGVRTGTTTTGKQPAKSRKATPPRTVGEDGEGGGTPSA